MDHLDLGGFRQDEHDLDVHLPGVKDLANLHHALDVDLARLDDEDGTWRDEQGLLLDERLK